MERLYIVSTSIFGQGSSGIFRFTSTGKEKMLNVELELQKTGLPDVELTDRFIESRTDA